MLDKMKQELLELENSTKRNKSVRLSFRCPLITYKMIYYYMKENGIDNKTDALSELLNHGFIYYSGKE